MIVDNRGNIGGEILARLPPDGYNALMAGEVHVMFANAAIASTHVRSGKVRALAVASLHSTPVFPDLPSLAGSGIPGLEAGVVQGIVAPAKTPAALISRLNQEIVRMLNRADVKERHFNAGVETIGSTPEELLATMKSDMARLGKVIKDANIRVE